MSNYIIGFFVFAAFARAAREYQKSMLAWGLIGLAAFFVPQIAIAFVGVILMRSFGAPGASSVLFVVAFVASAMIAVWAYNKLMEGAIKDMAALDASDRSQVGAAGAGSDGSPSNPH